MYIYTSYIYRYDTRRGGPVLMCCIPVVVARVMDVLARADFDGCSRFFFFFFFFLYFADVRRWCWCFFFCLLFGFTLIFRGEGEDTRGSRNICRGMLYNYICVLSQDRV